MTVIKAHAHTKEPTHEAKENALANQYAKQSALTQVHLARQIKDDLITPDYFYETLSKLQLKHQTLKKKKRILGEIWMFPSSNGLWRHQDCPLVSPVSLE